MGKRILSTLLAIGMLLLLSLPCGAEEPAQAVDITRESTLTQRGSPEDAAQLQDGNEATRIRFQNGGTITLTGFEATAALYLVWDLAPKEWLLEAPNGPIRMGQNQHLHQYVLLPAEQTTVTLTFEGPAVLCELRQFTTGTPPPGVQNWSEPLKDADLLLLPTHADDEHLYFGGIIPTYTARGKAVQVAYMVHHQGEPHRQHELLNGLWAAGIRNYPIIPPFADQYSGSLAHAKSLYNPDILLAYQVELIRRFRPEVIVGHDINGEYGHGAHCLNATTLQKAVVAAAEGRFHQKSVLKYGIWNTPKTYLHLWPERTVTMDWSIPLAAFGGATAFEMAVNGFAQHASQQRYCKVEQEGPHDCRKFGLFRTTVGDDFQKEDFFENIRPKQ